MPITIPFRFLVDDIADADQVNSNFDAIAARFNAGIVDADCSPSMGLDGNKLSSDAAKQVPESRLGTNAVSARVLGSSSTGDSLRAVGTDHCKDSFLIARHIAAGIIPAAKLKLVEVTQAFTLATASQTVGVLRVAPGTALPAMSAMLPISCTLEGVSSTAAVWAALVSLSQDTTGTPYYAVVGYGSTGLSPVMTGTIRFRYMQLT